MECMKYSEMKNMEALEKEMLLDIKEAPTKMDIVYPALVIAYMRTHQLTTEKRCLRVCNMFYRQIKANYFLYQNDTVNLFYRLLKNHDWKSIYIIAKWAAYPDLSPFNTDTFTSGVDK